MAFSLHTAVQLFGVAGADLEDGISEDDNTAWAST
jgi:hypothetical protein